MLLLILCTISSFSCSTPEQNPPLPSHSAPEKVQLPDNYRTCTSSQDCVVVYTIDGLTHSPQKGDSCASKCTFGIAKHAQEKWEQLRAQTHNVPCDMEMEPCPSKIDWSVQCIQNQCESVYKKENP